MFKNNRRNSLIQRTLRLPVRYPRTKRQFILIMVESCKVLLHMLLVCIRSYLKSVMGNRFLNIRPRYIYARKDVRVRGYISKSKGVREQRSLENTALSGMRETMLANNKIESLITFKSSFPTRFIMRSLSGRRSLRCQKLSQL